MKQFAYEILKWLPVISIFVNLWIASSTAKEVVETGKSTWSFIKLLAWLAILALLTVTAAS